MIDCSKLKSLSFGRGIPYNGPDFKIMSSHDRLLENYDVLIFTDSKGTASRPAGSMTWAQLVLEELAKHGLSYLFISRPRDLTIFFTLMNFIRENPLSFQYLITNVGFVDFTPKKIEYMKDILEQSPFSEQDVSLKFRFLSKYRLSNGELADLYTFEYGSIEPIIAAELEMRFKYSLLLGCMEFSSDIRTERERPNAFFSQLKRSNQFLFDVAQRSNSIHYVQPLKYQSSNESLLSYDAVHFTQKGHIANYALILPFVRNYIIGNE